MIHFIYQTTSPSGKFYRGRHSTTDINDGYLGSGKWVRSIKNKSELRREILTFANSFEELLILEEQFISEVIGNPNNMNFNNRAVGWPVGQLNWASTDEAKQLKSLRKKGLSLENQFGSEKASQIKNKISLARTGYKTNAPAWNTGLTKETSNIIAQSAQKNIGREPWNKGKATGIRTFTGEKHKQESIDQMRQTQKANRLNDRITCEHCGKNLDKANYCRYHGSKCKLKH